MLFDPNDDPGLSGRLSVSREWRLYLADLLLGCEKIQRYTFGLD